MSGGWLMSTGAPVLMAPIDLLPAWQGAGSADYDRACRVSCPVAPIAIGNGVGLEFASRLGATTWRPLLPHLLQPSNVFRADVADSLLIRCHDRLSDDALVTVIAPLLGQRFTPHASAFVTRSPCMLLEASDPGTIVRGRWLGVAIQAGSYSVSSLEHNLHDGGSLLLHRLTVSQSA